MAVWTHKHYNIKFNSFIESLKGIFNLIIDVYFAPLSCPRDPVNMS